MKKTQPKNKKGSGTKVECTILLSYPIYVMLFLNMSEHINKRENICQKKNEKGSFKFSFCFDKFIEVPSCKM